MIKLQDIYASFAKELKDAVDMIDVNGVGFTSGDVVFGGDMARWKKFGNSLRLRVALRISNTDNYAAAKAIAAEEGIEFMTSNGDNAAFEYVGGGATNSPLYDAWWTSARNDFTVAKPFINILKGVNDTLNNKVNPSSALSIQDYRSIPGTGLPAQVNILEFLMAWLKVQPRHIGTKN